MPVTEEEREEWGEEGQGIGSRNLARFLIDEVLFFCLSCHLVLFKQHRCVCAAVVSGACALQPES